MRRNSYIRTGVVRYSKRQINLTRIFPAEIQAIYPAILIAWTVKRNFVDFYPYRYETMELKVLPLTLYIICITFITIIVIIIVYTKLYIYISIINYICTGIRKKLCYLNELYFTSISEFRNLDELRCVRSYPLSTFSFSAGIESRTNVETRAQLTVSISRK